MLQSSDHDSLVISGGRLIDPGTGRDEIGDLFIHDGRIVEIEAVPTVIPAQTGTARSDGALKRIDGSGLIVCPGLSDIHVHIREPGAEHKETIETGTRAAAAGGFTFVACMPNTNPPIDTAETVRFVQQRAAQAGFCQVGPVACITKRRSGKELTDFKALKDAGAVAFSDDGVGVEDDALMREAFCLARAVDAVLIQHCETSRLSAGGVMHLGSVSRRVNLPGLDPRSEEAMIERDLRLIAQACSRYHVAHISTAAAVELVRQAKSAGLPVTAEVCPHHLLLTDEACGDGDPNTKIHPPLRTFGDVNACRMGLVDGTIDCIATDHAPHTAAEKAVGFLKAPPGIVGLETAIALSARAMIEAGLADWADLIRWFTVGKTRVLGLPTTTMNVGSTANLTLIDPDCQWTIDPANFISRSCNTPFAGWQVVGRPVATIRGTRLQTVQHLPV